MRWPTAKCFLSAVPRSMTTSPGCGQAPDTKVSVLKSGFVGSTLKPRLGAPPKVIALPSWPIRWASPWTWPTAERTSGRAVIRLSTDSSNEGAAFVPFPWSPAENAGLPVTATSVFL